MCMSMDISRWFDNTYWTHADLSNIYHAQVVHKTGPVLPDLRWGAAEWLHSDFLTAVQFPYCPHHHMHRIKHQCWRELWKGERKQETYGGGERQRGEGRKRSEERQGVKGEDAMRREVRAQMIEWLTGMQRGKQGKQEESERRDVRYE